MLLNNGKHNGTALLSEKAVAELRRIQTASIPMKQVPKAATGLPYALGAWALEANGNQATVLAGSGLFGTWPVVDYCRGYTFLIVSKELLRDEKADVYQDLKKLVDGSFPSLCR